MSDEQQKPRAVFADPGRMRTAEYERQEWVLTADPGVVIDDLSNPAYWAHVAAQFRPYARIEVRADDGTWIAEFIVLAADRTWAKVQMLRSYKLTSAEEVYDLVDQFEVKFRGPAHKWSVIRRDDGAVLKSEAQTRDEAQAWLRDYQAKVLTT